MKSALQKVDQKLWEHVSFALVFVFVAVIAVQLTNTGQNVGLVQGGSLGSVPNNCPVMEDPYCYGGSGYSSANDTQTGADAAMAKCLDEMRSCAEENSNAIQSNQTACSARSDCQYSHRVVYDRACKGQCTKVQTDGTTCTIPFTGSNGKAVLGPGTCSSSGEAPTSMWKCSAYGSLDIDYSCKPI